MSTMRRAVNFEAFSDYISVTTDFTRMNLRETRTIFVIYSSKP
jgi:hypothetical protein